MSNEKSTTYFPPPGTPDEVLLLESILQRNTSSSDIGGILNSPKARANLLKYRNDQYRQALEVTRGEPSRRVDGPMSTLLRSFRRLFS